LSHHPSRPSGNVALIAATTGVFAIATTRGRSLSWHTRVRAGRVPIRVGSSMSGVVKRSASQTAKSGPSRRGGSRTDSPLPAFIPPQLSQPVDKPPSGPQWLHEIKLDGFRMAARIEDGRAQLLTRTGLDWSDKYPSIVAALADVKAKAAYIDGELWRRRRGVAELRPDPGGDRWRGRGAARLLCVRSPAP
jgi:hypothetical protein